jgi:hypothetical protein
MWMQDYMTIALMKQALLYHFIDDEVEHPILFDSNLDFWGYCYEEQKRVFKSVRWHVEKEMAADLKLVAQDNEDSSFAGPSDNDPNSILYVR